jgi:hypothetical protein
MLVSRFNGTQSMPPSVVVRLSVWAWYRTGQHCCVRSFDSGGIAALSVTW